MARYYYSCLSLYKAYCSIFFAYDGFVMMRPLGINGPSPICGIPAMLILAIFEIWVYFPSLESDTIGANKGLIFFSLGSMTYSLTLLTYELSF